MVQQGSFSELQSNDVSINSFITKEPTEYLISPVASRPSALKFQNTANTTPVLREAPDLARQTGDLSVYLYFARSMGWLNLVLFLATVALHAFASEFQAVLLQWWSEAETSNPGLDTDTYMGLYAMLAALALISIVSLLCVVLLVAGPKASIELHNILLASVMAAPYSWFVSTDTGITLNRYVSYSLKVIIY
jgi:ATP-binding cassette subfamily C (CFTR/MRP) protein 1